MRILLRFLIALSLTSVSMLAVAAEGVAATGKYSTAHTAASQLPRLHSLLINQGDDLVFEQYYNGRDPSRPANMKSASKSVISALVGIAIDRGIIDSVDVKVAKYFPELIAASDDLRKQQITIENLLTMQSGLETTSNRNYGKWVLSDNWVEFALNQPLVAEPGTRMLYSTGSTHLLSAIVTKASGMSAKQFAQENLSSRLGFSMSYWPQDPQGIYFGGNDMEMTPRQMLEFGRLYLNEGRVDNAQVISKAWVEDSHQPRARSPRGQGRFYGYGWWLRDLAGMQIPVAWGYGGQLIFVVKELDLVVVATSQSTPGPSRRGHLRSLYELIEEHVLLPAKALQLSSL
ncbi:MAG: 6-aminohexanoate hydrolase [SAR86 cluster bacterium]|uniref:6-aminohexanoate hydrolase n=1 Tax=SAR86 cluster bacterium TaxID=2030880 RepID=A0A2A4XAM4_9GAMM|nr:MAG: 6-aminohexanoate hydrolase [SAR86 cluster bacterium]